jgi:DNA uptake protein ComE-like DNA-binding protein
VSGVVFSNEEATHVIDMIDKATPSELRAIAGIGGKTAERIIDARPYGSLADPLLALDEVAYVGPSILENLRTSAYANWCALDDGRQACCVELGCEGTFVATVGIGADDVHGLLDWANRADFDQLDAVCGVGPSIAQGLIDARPLHSTQEVLDVSHIGPSTLFKMLGKDGQSCSSQGDVTQEWCGLADAKCVCQVSPSAFQLDEDAASNLAEEAAGVFFADNADLIWEEFCQFSYDHSLGFDEIAVINICDQFVIERFVAGAIEASTELVGIEYASEAEAISAVAEFVESFFFAQVDDWMAGFGIEVNDQLGQ